MRSRTDDSLDSLLDLTLRLLRLVGWLLVLVLGLLIRVLLRVHVRHLGTGRGRFLLWLSASCAGGVVLCTVLLLTTRAAGAWLGAGGAIVLVYGLAVAVTDLSGRSGPFDPGADDRYGPWQRR